MAYSKLMQKLYAFACSCFLLIGTSLYGQLTEDFTCDNPPCSDVLLNEWSHEPAFDPGNASGRWSFVNPSNRVFPGAFNDEVLIFDAEFLPDGAGDTASVITPIVNCANSSNVILKMTHLYKGGPGAKGIVSVSNDNGGTWTAVKTFYSAIANPANEIINITSLAAGQQNVRVRFTWESPLELGYWAITYMEVLSPVQLDASIVSLLSPTAPLSSNDQDVIVSVMNTGATEIDSIAFNISIDGINTSVMWYGHIPVCGIVDSIFLGTYQFLSGVLSDVNVSVSEVNGLPDIGLLANNVSTAVAAPLCGVYTIGTGASSCACPGCQNFVDFSDAADFLNTYGVSCQTVFLVSQGEYNEQIQLGSIYGSSESNNVIFRGCGLGGVLPRLYFNGLSTNSPCVVELIGTDNITFEYLDVWTESQYLSSFYLHEENENITIQNCSTADVICTEGSVFQYLNNNAAGSNLYVNQELSGDSVIIRGNFIDSIIVNNTDLVAIQDNRDNQGLDSILTGLEIQACNDVIVSENLIRRMVSSECNSLVVDLNDIDSLFLNQCSNVYVGHNELGLGSYTSGDTVDFEFNEFAYFHFNDLHNLNVKSNEAVNYYSNPQYPSLYAVGFSECSEVVMRQNNLVSDFGIAVSGASSVNVVIANNSLEPLNSSANGTAISFSGLDQWVRADSNIIDGFVGVALYANCPEVSPNSNVRYNSNIITNGLNNAIRIDAGAIEMGRNRISGYSEGSAVYLNGAGCKLHNNYIHVEGIASCAGIEVAQGAVLSSLCFNSVLVESSDYYNSAALKLGELNESLEVINNSFSNEGNGFGVIVSGLVDLNGITGGRNNFYSLYNRLAKYNGVDITTWDGFTTSMGGLALDAFNVIPMYISDVELQCNHFDLNNSGMYCEMNADIDNVVRPNNAIDIGAKKWDLCDNDASVTAFNNLMNPLVSDSLYPMYVTVMNMGSNQLTAAEIGWTVNGILQPSNTWTGTLNPGESELFFMGFYEFSAQNDFLYELSAHVNTANNVEDCNHYNDTIVSIKYAIPLCGTIIIGSQPNDDLENFTQLSEVLNLSGIECQTLVLVREGLYDEKFNLDSIPGTDMYSLLIQSFNNDPNSVLLGSLVSNPPYSVLLNGTRKLRLDKIGIRTSGEPVDAVYFDSAANDITLSGCSFYGRISNSGMANCNDVKILGNAFNGGDLVLNCAPGSCSEYLIDGNTGIRNLHVTNLDEVTVSNNNVVGDLSNPSLVNQFFVQLLGVSGKLILESNTVSNVFQGISISNCDSVFARFNTVNMNSPGLYNSPQGMAYSNLNYLNADTNQVWGSVALYGMSFNNDSNGDWHIRGNSINGICGKSMVVSGIGGEYMFNRILSGISGVGIDCNSSSCSILNNYISLNSEIAVSGLRLSNQSFGDTVAYNTVSVTGLTSNNSNAASVSGHDHIIVNNIFAAFEGAAAIKYEIPPSNVYSDYNCYYSDAGDVWEYNNAFFSTLSSFLASAGLNSDVNSIVANPFFGDNNLIPSQGLLNGNGTTQIITERDILGVLRNSSLPDIGANELTVCSEDASLVEYVDLSQNMNSIGVPLTVILQNAGTSTLSQTSIHWSINGQEQSPVNVADISLLSQATLDVFIGIIPSGLPLYEIQVWVEGINGSPQDCNTYNDSLSSVFIYSSLCGEYELGGLNSDFSNFSDVANALHIAGVSCPVTINVLPGNYYEQVDFLTIPGASQNNTITIQSEGNTPSAFLNYNNAPNCASGYILNVNGADHLQFKNLGIYGNNIYLTDIIVRTGSDHLSFQNCILGNTVYDQGAVVEGAEFINNTFVSPKLILALGSGSSSLIFDGNSGLGNLSCSNASDVLVLNNQIRRINASSFDVALFESNLIDTCDVVNIDSLVIENNNLATTSLSNAGSLTMLGNTLENCSVNASQFIDFRLNSVQKMAFNASQYMEVTSNYSSGNEGFLDFNGCNYLNCYGNSLNSKTGVKIENTDNARIHHNTIDCQLIEQSFGIVSSGASEYLLIDSNLVRNHTSGGIHVQSTASVSAIVSYNEVSGSGVQLKLSGSGVIVQANRVVNCMDATGILIDGEDMVVFNNYFQMDGESVCKGAFITSNEGVSFFYNSILLNGTNGGNRALQVNLIEGSEAVYNIKNNIFSVSPPSGSVGNFTCFELNTAPGANFNCDYNCFYSSNSVVGKIANAPYVNLNAFMSVLLQDGGHHCISVNPNFASNSNLLPYNILINRQGIGLNGLFDLYPGLNLDIDGEIRDNYQPDIGAQEFRANFAVLELIAPTLDCVQSSNEEVTTGIRQYGDIPFFDIQIAYSVNGGEPVFNVIPGAQFNDIDYTFQDALADLSGNGQYDFEIWLVNNFDDVAADDTLRVSRYSLPSPLIQSFSFEEDCANVPIEFSGSATATGGVITSLEWDFGDNTQDIGDTVFHVFDAAAEYEISLYAYRDSACYSDTSGIINLLPTPQISFSLLNLCSGSELQFVNGTALLNGSGPMSFDWDFGDGSTSTAANPIHVFDTAGYYNVFLSAERVVGTSVCSDTLSQNFYINSPPLIEFTLEETYPINTPDLILSAQPLGGSFSGNGVIDGVLNFSSLPVNSHIEVYYSYLDTLTGCSSIVSESVLITPFYDPPVITQQPTDYLACEGSSFFLSVSTTGELPMTYQWFRNGEPLPDETNALLSVTASSSSEDQGEYQLRIINAYDTVFSDLISVELGNADSIALDTILCPNSFLSFGENIVADTGDYVIVLVNRFNCDSTLYLHVMPGYTDVVELDTAACAPFVFNGQSFFDDGDYVVILTNRVGCDSIITLHYNKVVIGESCDDGNPCTINDVYDNDCICNGIITMDEDFDGLCDGQDICLNNPEPGQPCDDLNPCTSLDVMGDECICSGLPVPDSDNDGVCDSAEVFGCGDSLACNYNPLTTDNYATCFYPFVGYDCEGNCVVFINGSCLNLGCTQPGACNYDPTANFDNDSCQFAGCTDFSACNFDSNAGCDDGSCVFPGCMDSLACNYSAAAVCDDGSCLNPGCMDALACNYDVDAICDTGSCILPSCTDTSACNFDVNAVCSGDLCIYPGCLDYSACNYDSLAGCDDGSCLTAGCLDSAACNFDPLAFCDGFNCLFSGCTDIMACNYDSLASCEGNCNYPDVYYNCDSTCIVDSDDDGICDPLEIIGCMDLSACNYDSSATDESAGVDSCVYAAEGYDCGDSCLFDDDQDGICNPFEVPGCMDESACNFNTLATDSSDCEYVPVYAIVGEVEVFLGDTVVYSYPITEGSVYVWSVSGGDIIEGDSTNQILVVFSESDSQFVSVVETTAEGCMASDTASYLVVEVVLGIRDYSSLSSVPLIFPNPADDLISVKALNEWSNGSWRIYNALGHILKSGSLSGNLSIVSVNDLASGVYQMEFVSISGSVSKISFVKR